MSSLLAFCDISFSRKDRAILRHAEFSVQAGEVVALLGPNGVGKSTLLYLAAGLLQPSSGEILLHGRSLAATSRTQRAREVALVPQLLHAPFAFTVQQMLEQARTPHVGMLGRLAAADHVAVERAFSLTDTAHFRHRIFQELSGGEQQRVKIALGLAQGSGLLLLDEPTQNLDAGWQRNLLAMISDLGKENIAVIAAIHELHLVADYFPSSLLLTQDGPLLAGSTATVLASDTLQRAFYGDTP